MDDIQVKNFKDLLVWQKAMQIAKQTYQATAHFPSQERFGMTSQMRRSAISIPSNIAEGQARNSTAEFIHFISIALGSAAELETQIILSEELDYLNSGNVTHIINNIHECCKMMKGLQKSLEKRL